MNSESVKPLLSAEEINNAAAEHYPDMDQPPYWFTMRREVQQEAFAKGAEWAASQLQPSSPQLEQQLSQSPNWVKAWERLPEEGEMVLLFTVYNKIEFGQYWWEQGHNPECWRVVDITGQSRTELNKVTHWMPLPQPPTFQSDTLEENKKENNHG